MNDQRASLDPGEAAGQAVLARALAAARLEFGPELVSAYALGSLAHGGFQPHVSDVDLALLLVTLDASTKTRVSQVQREVAGSLGTPLAGRLSIFWSSWEALASGQRVGRFPAGDRADLRDSGVLLHGEDRRSELPAPSRGELVVEAVEFMLDRWQGPHAVQVWRDPDLLLVQGTREVTKRVLFPVRFIFTAEQGRLGSNPQAVRHYAATRRGAAPQLALQALEWREHGLGDRSAALDLLRRGLPELARDLGQCSSAALHEAGQPALARQLEGWLAQLDRRD